jgi:hypothetical protein
MINDRLADTHFAYAKSPPSGCSEGQARRPIKAVVEG